ncbi:MAG TPA: nitrilase-related carbon-nitrogen hydrolase [Candidatus Dormibacteraeota bacterium]|nr:nitrilase-related carbon-nitrogen hydrolase [Candidatus Dormibacteraeota bacterium]
MRVTSVPEEAADRTEAEAVRREMPASRRLRIAGVQMSMGRDPADNLARALAHIDRAAARGADLVVLPELFSRPYFPQHGPDVAALEFAEPIPGPTSDALAAAAARHGITVVGSVYERVFTGLQFNTAVVLGPDGRLIGRSRKTHIPDERGYSEKFFFTPGDSDYPVFGLADGTSLAVATCWDQWFPELARIVALKGADVIAYPTAIGSEPDHPDMDTHDAWRTVMRGHAIANALFVVAVNRVGTEAGLRFYGGSFIADPLGVVLA